MDMTIVDAGQASPFIGLPTEPAPRPPGGPAKLAYPLTRPGPPPLSRHAGDLAAIERSAILSNFGPVSTTFEREMSETLFGGLGPCLAVCNATAGLMLALKDAAWRRRDGARHVIMPALTFAAAAQAALWIGLIPVIVDVDPDDWTAAAEVSHQFPAREILCLSPVWIR